MRINVDAGGVSTLHACRARFQEHSVRGGLQESRLLQYSTNKNWMVSALSDKGFDLGCASIAAPDPSQPIESATGLWVVWNDIDKKWEAKAEVKVCSDAEAEARAKAEAEARAKAEAEARLRSGRYLPVVLSGLSVANAAKNGIYDPTAEMINGGLVYKARHKGYILQYHTGDWMVSALSDGDYILQYSTNTKNWMVTDLGDKGTDRGCACIAAPDPSQPIESATGTWKVWNDTNKQWEDKAEVKVRSVSAPA